jgi:hypothetical protein
MILKKLIDVKTEWSEGPCIEILSNLYEVYAFNLFIFSDGNWHNIEEKFDVKPYHFFKHFLTLRLKWRVKVYGFANDKIELLYDEIYNEEGKNVCLVFEHDQYDCQKDWVIKTQEIAQKYKFKPYIISSFHKKLQKDFTEIKDCFFSKEGFYSEDNLIKNEIYAKYIITRNDIPSNTENMWESSAIFLNNSVAFKSWNHRQDWVSKNHKEVYDDIMNYE